MFTITILLELITIFFLTCANFSSVRNKVNNFLAKHTKFRVTENNTAFIGIILVIILVILFICQ